MNEREINNEYIPHLTRAEVEALKDLAKNFGHIRQADYPQVGANADPYFYTLKISSATIDSCNERLSEYSDWKITEVQIEYNDQMEDLCGSEVEAAISVEVKSVLNAQSEPFDVKEVRYLFILESSQRAIVQDIDEDEGQLDVTNRVAVDQLSNGELVERLPPRYRQLTLDDVQLLRLLIS